MKVHVLYFASLKDKAGKETEDFDIGEGGTVKTLISHIKANNEPLSAFLNSRSFRYAVNQEFVDLDAALKHGDEIAILPPLSGG